MRLSARDGGVVATVIVGTHDEWQVAERRYLPEESMAALATSGQTDLVTIPEAPLAVTA